jgi:hypothetical protein
MLHDTTGPLNFLDNSFRGCQSAWSLPAAQANFAKRTRLPVSDVVRAINGLLHQQQFAGAVSEHDDFIAATYLARNDVTLPQESKLRPDNYDLVAHGKVQVLAAHDSARRQVNQNNLVTCLQRQVSTHLSFADRAGEVLNLLHSSAQHNFVGWGV